MAASEGTPCSALITPGTVGECGEVVVGGDRTAWTIERATAPAGTASHTVRILGYAADAGGWVEQLRAADPAGDRWVDLGALPADVTGDAVPELLVGFRGADDRSALGVDVVGFDPEGEPRVLAHVGPAPKGVITVAVGRLELFEGEYPNDEPGCCPPSYLRRTIVHGDGVFRVVASETVLPNVVPASQL